MFNSVYKNTSVFLTGHTGFKGSWLTMWLELLGAKVTGYALEPHGSYNHWDGLELSAADIRGDIRSFENLSVTINKAAPKIVFHLAAQPLVRQSYFDPLETWSTNVMGTANLLEACRNCPSVQAIVIITTDKVYDNKEWSWGYRETDRLGGYDPYSASKAATELVTDSFRKSFFNKDPQKLVATVRAGNVIGGGDWSIDRIIPDLIRSVQGNKPLTLRSPYATRPWQHVLDCLSGYLLVGQKLLEGSISTADSWNFGPSAGDNRMVIEILQELKKNWDLVNWVFESKDKLQVHEAGVLYLDSSKAHKLLKWKPVWSLDTTLQNTVSWYRSFLSDGQVTSRKQLEAYLEDARTMSAVWVDK